MQIRSQEEILGRIKDCAKEVLRLQNAKKKIDEEIREIKKAYKEDGIATGLVNKAINNIKKKKKQNPSEEYELDIICNALEEDKEIDTLITENVAR